jgi:hypothetical protein
MSKGCEVRLTPELDSPRETKRVVSRPIASIARREVIIPRGIHKEGVAIRRVKKSESVMKESVERSQAIVRVSLRSSDRRGVPAPELIKLKGDGVSDRDNEAVFSLAGEDDVRLKTCTQLAELFERGDKPTCVQRTWGERGRRVADRPPIVDGQDGTVGTGKDGRLKSLAMLQFLPDLAQEGLGRERRREPLGGLRPSGQNGNLKES